MTRSWTCDSLWVSGVFAQEAFGHCQYPNTDALMHARSIALSGRGPNAVTLDCNDRLIVPRGSQLGRATAARSRDALSVGFHQPGLRRDRPTPSDRLSRTAGISPTTPTSVGYRPDSLTHPLHRSSEHLRGAGLPHNLPTGIDEFGWMCAIGGLGWRAPKPLACASPAGWLSPEHSRLVQLVPAERQRSSTENIWRSVSASCA
jgi:hypothetical protein